MPADGSAPTPTPHALTDAALRRIVVALAPLAELASVAGLRGRSRDPREHPGSGGEQRDAAAALDAASDRGTLTAARFAFTRLCRLPPDLQRTGEWIAARGGAVRGGAPVSVAEWSETYGRLEGPLLLREEDARWRDLAAAAEVRLRAAKRALCGGMTPERAREMESARLAHDSAAARAPAQRAALAAWGLARLEAFAAAWEGT